MKLTNAAAFKDYLKRPKALEMSNGTLYVKQMKISEHDALRKQMEGLQGVEGEEGDGAETTSQMGDIIVSLLTDEKGDLIFTVPETIAEFKACLTLDFVREFFDKFWSSFAFTSKELAEAEATFRK
jgi:hypothetical protein